MSRSATCSPPCVLWVLALFQSDESFDAWGWRIPFLLSAVLVLIGLWIRLSIEESPVFAANKKALENHQGEHAPIIEVLRKYPREVLIAMGLRMVENTAYYIFTIVVMTYMVTYLDMPKSAAIAGVLIASVAQFFLTPLVGALSDRIGRRPLYFTGAVGCRHLGIRVLPAHRHREPDHHRRGDLRRPDLHHTHVRPAGRDVLRTVRHQRPLQRRLAGLPARLRLRRRPGALHRGRPCWAPSRKRTPWPSASTSRSWP